MSKTILVTGATGKQGGSVVDALIENYPGQYEILAVTRDTSSNSAKKLSSKTGVKVVQGDMNDVPSLFAEAKKTASSGSLYGVYSVQLSQGKGVTHDGEIAQGIGMVDEAVKNNVKHFVYSSVDRGGDSKSWDTPTPIPHFSSKHAIEHHLRDNAGSMGWTILRPVAFMDNLAPGFQMKVFLTALRNVMGDDKPLQWVATADIGTFAAKAFAEPNEFNHKAIGLAGDELTFPQLSKAFQNKTGTPAGTTFGFLGSALNWGVPEMGTMIKWFATDGYGADIKKLKSVHPDLMDMETWLVKKSAFETK